MPSWMLPRRSSEGLASSIAASGAAGTGIVADPIDGDRSYRRAGEGMREVPAITVERARALSVHHYRTNPMARAIVDTFTSFCVGDSGLSVASAVPQVRDSANRFWADPANKLRTEQELLFRSHMLMGETALHMLVGPTTGVTRFAYIDPVAVSRVELLHGNPMWPSQLVLDTIGNERRLQVVDVDDLTGFRTGEAMWWPDWRAIASDRRGTPFLMPLLDWIEAYDQVLWNLIDRTALARYMVFDVTVKGQQKDVDDWIAKRGSTAPPRSGSMEVHNEGVSIEPKNVQVGAFEDKVTGQMAMTNIAAGAGLAKTWLAEPEDANRATSLTMAEPVRRRVGGVQNIWLSHMTELTRFAIDARVRVGQLAPEYQVGTETDQVTTVSAADAVTITGPEIAAADAKVNAEILVQLSNALTGMQAAGILSEEASKVAARKAWEDYVGVPWDPSLDRKAADGDTDDVADYIDDVGGATGPISVAA
jgi:hypothetical protein